ncbi:hypothetical protein Ssi02_71590 [Sinosporangium siamense]|uniref:Uncharacterized protein n=1 Tax=Sinosporangium siamense TaxID=1367973 RepID=A0A919RNG2_9ACTN|nr:hypothetical protein Ssi02_71590 [Sinosporangium siamense]
MRTVFMGLRSFGDYCAPDVWHRAMAGGGQLLFRRIVAGWGFCAPAPCWGRWGGCAGTVASQGVSVPSAACWCGFSRRAGGSNDADPGRQIGFPDQSDARWQWLGRCE